MRARGPRVSSAFILITIGAIHTFSEDIVIIRKTPRLATHDLILPNFSTASGNKRHAFLQRTTQNNPRCCFLPPPFVAYSLGRSTTFLRQTADTSLVGVSIAFLAPFFNSVNDQRIDQQ
jgi:hypothetical protein